LDSACGKDTELRQRVEQLLRVQPKLQKFLEQPFAGPAPPADLPIVSERPGNLIGPYKLLEQIGEGGFGMVFMAEQQPLHRRVALKVIKPGMDSKQVIARFEAERQALALMDHPNIARILDAGTTDTGRPYFVMDLIKGAPITQYCDDNRLTTRERLELFVSVCQAVQHAHQKGIIHRDLKPSNVLVTLHDSTPVPKVIDFGIAKALGDQLTEKTRFTAFAQMVGTPLYMSPEQAGLSGLDVDTRSDLYALGVLLYELLTGTTPFDRERLRRSAFEEILRIIREEEPPKPSTRLSRLEKASLSTVAECRGVTPQKLGQLVRDELDWIVMKALEKDRARRYETANSLARDLQHYLADEPVEACPPTAGYKLLKFARKNKNLLGTAAAFAVLLLLGIAASVWQAVRATQAETVALDHEQKANENAVHARVKEQEANHQRDEVRALNERLRSTLYAAHINVAQHAWDAGNIRRVRELLEEHLPKPGESDLRGFEWHYLHRLCHAELFTLQAGGWDVAYSPDGKRLAGMRPRLGGPLQAGQILPPYLQELLNLTEQQQKELEGLQKQLAGKLEGVLNDEQYKQLKQWFVPILPPFLQQGLHLTAEQKKKLEELQKEADIKLAKILTDRQGKQLKEMRDGFGPGGPGAFYGAELMVWDAQTGQVLLTLKGGPRKVAFSPDSKCLFSAGMDQRVRVWDAQTGKELLTFKWHVPLNRRLGVAFSPDGRRLAGASSDHTVRVWDTQTGKELPICKGHTGRVWSVAFSPDGTRLASASEDKTVKVWDAQKGQEFLSLKGDSFSFGPDGKRLASAGDNLVKVWDVQTGQVLLNLTLKGADEGVVFSPDGKRLASTGEDEMGFPAVKVWDAQTGTVLLTIKPGTAQVNRVAFSPDGKRLATAGGDGTVKVWDAQTSQELAAFKGHTGMALNVVFSPDGTRLISLDRDGFKVWDAATSPEVRTFRVPRWQGAVVFSPDSKRLASGSGTWDEAKKADVAGTVEVWDAQTGQEPRVFKGHTGRVHSVAYSPDGKRLASASEDKTIKVWDAQIGQEMLALKGHTSSVTSVAYSPDGKRLASGGGGVPNEGKPGEIKVWDAQTGQELLSLKGHPRPVSSVAYSPDGKRLASASGEEVKVWDATSGNQVLAWKVVRPFHSLRMVVFSPDGKRLAGSVGYGPGPPGAGEVKVWDAQTGGELLSLKGHTGWVWSVAFSPDGKRLASGSGSAAQGLGGEVKVWDAQTGQELLSFPGGGLYHKVMFSPNGHWLASYEWWGGVRIYDATPRLQKP
jgi:WD40 repeat protein/serine/threonine protein kinase